MTPKDQSIRVWEISYDSKGRLSDIGDLLGSVPIGASFKVVAAEDVVRELEAMREVANVKLMFVRPMIDDLIESLKAGG